MLTWVLQLETLEFQTQSETSLRIATFFDLLRHDIACFLHLIHGFTCFERHTFSYKYFIVSNTVCESIKLMKTASDNFVNTSSALYILRQKRPNRWSCDSSLRITRYKIIVHSTSTRTRESLPTPSNPFTIWIVLHIYQ